MLDKQTKIIGEDRVLFEHIWKTGKGFYVYPNPEYKKPEFLKA